MIDYSFGVKLGSVIPWEVFFWRNDKIIFDTCRQFTLISKDHHDKWLRKIENDSSIKMFSVLSDDGRVIGVCGLTSIDWQARHAEISLYIAPEFQGKKYAKNTLKTLIKHAFEDFNLNKVWGEIFSTNTKSIHIFKDIGFSITDGHTQHYYRNGEYIDSFIATLLRKDYLKLSL
jgi:RimJ/RimL family protein N-acetyltransferase